MLVQCRGCKKPVQRTDDNNGYCDACIARIKAQEEYMRNRAKEMKQANTDDSSEPKDDKQTTNKAELLPHSVVTQNGGSVYDTKAWRLLSKRMLTEHPFCEMCLKEGKYTLAQIVDHIIELRDITDPEEKFRMAFTISNLQCLCRKCHLAKTKEEQNKRKQSNKDNDDDKDLFEFI